MTATDSDMASATSPSVDRSGAPGTGARGRYRYVTPYDRYVRFMRLVLPALAALIGGVGILWPLFEVEESSFMLNKDSMPGAGREVRAVGATFKGTDNAGRQFTVSAEEALQDSPDAPLVALTGIAAELALSDGRSATFQAASGVYDTATETVTVPGPIVLETMDGYHLEGRSATVDLQALTLVSDQPVSGSGPLGALAANGFSIDLESGKAVFDGAVKMRTTRSEKKG